MSWNSSVEQMSLARSLSVSLSAGLIQAKCFCFYAYKIHLFVILSVDWRRIRHVPTTLCGHYFSKHPAVLIMSIPFLPPVPPPPFPPWVGFAFLILPKVKPQFSWHRTGPRRAKPQRCLCLRLQSNQISFEAFQKVLLSQNRRYNLSLRSSGYKSPAGNITINACSFAKSIFGVYFAVILYSWRKKRLVVLWMLLLRQRC